MTFNARLYLPLESDLSSKIFLLILILFQEDEKRTSHDGKK